MKVISDKVTGDWINAAPTESLCRLLEGAGYQALFVGGCVRNALLGVPVADIDLSTDATPDEVQALAVAAGLRVVPTGIDHGTVTVIAGGIPHEVTTFRRDVETDGRHALVAFTKDVAEDAARRDFTMNALYARADGTVIDPLGGLPDLIARRLRFVGDASTRIREDALRILRFFRFHAHYGDPDHGIDAEGLAAIADLGDLVDGLSLERIGHEMRKLLTAPDPSPSVAAMAAVGVLARVLPGSDPTGLAPLVHWEGQVQIPPSWQCRLAVLGGLTENLRLSRAEEVLQSRLREAIGDMTSAAVLGNRMSVPAGTDVILARAALFAAPPSTNWQAELARGANSRFPVAASDLPELAGAALGTRLKALRAAWEAGNLTASKDDLLKKPA
jgi:poly(A) polymerase